MNFPHRMLAHETKQVRPRDESIPHCMKVTESGSTFQRISSCTPKQKKNTLDSVNLHTSPPTSAEPRKSHLTGRRRRGPLHCTVKQAVFGAALSGRAEFHEMMSVCILFSWERGTCGLVMSSVSCLNSWGITEEAQTLKA